MLMGFSVATTNSKSLVVQVNREAERQMDRNLHIPRVCERQGGNTRLSLSGLKWTDYPFLLSPGLSNVELFPAGRRRLSSLAPLFMNSVSGPPLLAQKLSEAFGFHQWKVVLFS